MIEKTGWGTFEEFVLICDHCEDSVEGFKEFDEAVDYKKKHWKSVKSESGDWYELCPDCSTSELISEYKNK